MSNTHTHNVRRKFDASKVALVACVLILALARPLYAQYTLTDIYDFNCATGGCEPQDYGQLTRFTDGKLYGTTDHGGTFGYGTIFSVSPDGSSYSDLWGFDGSTGEPVASLMLASDGNFYGGTSNCPNADALFRFTPPGTLKGFAAFPTCGLIIPPVEAQDGNLYGVYGFSSIYRLNLKKQVVTLLKHSAPGDLTAPLILANDGYMYGVTYDGGSHGFGSVFRVTPGGGAVKTIYNFTNGADGCGPEGPLFQFSGSVNTLYGTASGVAEGCTGNGTVFQLVLGKKPVLTTMHTFAGSDGDYPIAGLVGTPSGSLLGVTWEGGANGTGTAFEIAATSPFSFHKVADFFPVQSGAGGPVSSLLANTDGSFYGVVAYGSANGASFGDGYVYRLTPASIIDTVLIEGPVWVHPGLPVEVLGDNLEETVNVTFAGQTAAFQIGSNTSLTATVPAAAVDGPLVVTITNPAGGEEQLQAQQNMHILPIITNLDPSSGPVGTGVGIVGGGFIGATKVTFGGVKATSFTVNSPTLIHATVPAGAKTGKVKVTTPNGTATSNETFTVN